MAKMKVTGTATRNNVVIVTLFRQSQSNEGVANKQQDCWSLVRFSDAPQQKLQRSERAHGLHPSPCSGVAGYESDPPVATKEKKQSLNDDA